MAQDEGAPAREGDGVTGPEELKQAKGFGVETESGRIGCVAAVVPHAGSTGAGVLLVHAGGDACTLTCVPFDKVEDVDVGSRRVVLRSCASRGSRVTGSRGSCVAI
jgi:hypothetical protein